MRVGLGRRPRGHLDVGRLGVLLGELSADLLVLLSVRLLAVAGAVQDGLAGGARVEVRGAPLVRVDDLLGLVALGACLGGGGGCRRWAGIWFRLSASGCGHGAMGPWRGNLNTCRGRGRSFRHDGGGLIDLLSPQCVKSQSSSGGRADRILMDVISAGACD